MLHIPIPPDSTADENAFAPILDCLRGDGVIAAPTETVFGLMAIWKSAPARRRLYELKGRDFGKPLQMLAPNLATASRYGIRPNKRARQIAARFWPGPLTIVLPTTTQKTIGLRVPDHPLILRLLQLLDEPLAATSANLSGNPPATSPAEIPGLLHGDPDLLVTGQNAKGDQASTIIALLDYDRRILRQGPIAAAELKPYLTAP